MSAIHVLPEDTAVRHIFVMLYGNDVELKVGTRVLADAGKCLIGVFVNDDDQPVSACICGNDLAAFAGSALTQIPLGGAEDAAQTGEFSRMMLGNIQEIMNICSGLFMDNECPHLKFDRLYSTAEELPDGTLAMINSCEHQVDFNITIPGYGCGDVSFVVT